MRAFILLVALLLPASASAWTVASNFADGCHEALVVGAFTNYAIDLPIANIIVPDDEVTTGVGDRLIADVGLDIEDPRQRFLFTSLLIGVRSPDTEGQGLLDLSAIRQIHAAKDGQYLHALRAVEDDGPEADQRAIGFIREEILNSLRMANEFISKPVEEQNIVVDVYLEFYGQVDITVWGVAYHFARALHTFQDSFSHTIRSDDLRRVRHVMNYAEAIDAELDEPIDGMAHSDSMDKCENETLPLYSASREATLEMMIAITSGNGEPAWTATLDDWLTYEDGCNYGNNYCNSKWVPVAREEATGPYIETYLGCSSGGPANMSLIALLLFATAAFGTRRRKLLLFAAIGLAVACGDEEESFDTMLNIEEFTPCGGELDGLYHAFAVISEDEPFAVDSDLCGEFQVNVDFSNVGSVRFGDDEIQGDLRIRRRYTSNIDSECPKRVAQTCEAFVPPAPLAFCADRGDTCVCSATILADTELVGPLSFPEDGVFAFTNPDDTEVTVEYCVNPDGRTLDMRSMFSGDENDEVSTVYTRWLQ